MSVRMSVPGVYFISMADAGPLLKWLSKHGALSIRVPGESIHDAASFFSAAVDCLPLDPPLGGGVHPDAFIDSLWEGIAKLRTSTVAIIWSHADQIIRTAPDDFYNLVTCLRWTAEDLEALDNGLATPVSVKIFLLGSGDGFHSLRDYGFE